MKRKIDEHPFDTTINRIKQLDMKQNQFEFKPFDKILVRDSNKGPWRASLYSHLSNSNYHVCIAGVCNQCIPYNEETAHLINTNEPYIPPQPKEYHVWSNSFDEWMTEDEFQNFIKTAVINNKDITDFHVLRIK